MPRIPRVVSSPPARAATIGLAVIPSPVSVAAYDQLLIGWFTGMDAYSVAPVEGRQPVRELGGTSR